jgi:hypothetical protein
MPAAGGWADGRGPHPFMSSIELRIVAPSVGIAGFVGAD